MDRLHVNEKIFATSISHKMCYRTEILTDGAEKKMLMKAADDVF